MAEYILPDYSNCGLNVACSVLRYFGAKAAHPGHKDVDALLAQKPYRNVVVMLFDAMGMATLRDHLPENSFLRSHVAREMTAVFPSTTVAATTTIESGDSPMEHGWLGWSVYFEPIDRMVDVFINRDSLTGEPMEGERISERFIPYKNIVERLHEAGGCDAHIISRFGDTPAETLDDVFDVASRLCEEDGKHYLYCYWGEPDHTMHEEGVMSVGDIVRDINDRVERFAAEAGDDTLILVTADHGQLDCENLYVDAYPELMAACKRATAIEARATVFYVKDECKAQFEEIFEKTIGTEHFLLMKSEDALGKGLFGPGEAHPMFRSFIGDYIAIAVDRYSIWWKHLEKPLVGQHAGLTPREMLVPLIVAKK